jgi:hypothetical protein
MLYQIVMPPLFEPYRVVIVEEQGMKVTNRYRRWMTAGALFCKVAVDAVGSVNESPCFDVLV